MYMFVGVVPVPIISLDAREQQECCETTSLRYATGIFGGKYSGSLANGVLL